MTLCRIQVASIGDTFLAMLSNTKAPAQPPEPDAACNDDVCVSQAGQLANARRKHARQRRFLARPLVLGAARVSESWHRLVNSDYSFPGLALSGLDLPRAPSRCYIVGCMAKTKPPPFKPKHVRCSNSNLRFDWNGKLYATKQVRPIFVDEAAEIVVVTVYT
jgi:hypothetical protein